LEAAPVSITSEDLQRIVSDEILTLEEIKRFGSYLKKLLIGSESMLEDVPLYDVKSKYYDKSPAQSIVDQIIIDRITKKNSHTKMSGLESQINLETRFPLRCLFSLMFCLILKEPLS